jgi:hypothetical protein
MLLRHERPFKDETCQPGEARVHTGTVHYRYWVRHGGAVIAAVCCQRDRLRSHDSRVDRGRNVPSQSFLSRSLASTVHVTPPWTVDMQRLKPLGGCTGTVYQYSSLGLLRTCPCACLCLSVCIYVGGWVVGRVACVIVSWRAKQHLVAIKIPHQTIKLTALIVDPIIIPWPFDRVLSGSLTRLSKGKKGSDKLVYFLS